MSETTTRPTTLVKIFGKHRMKQCDHLPCQEYATLRFLARNRDLRASEWYACGEDHVAVIADDLQKMGLKIL